MFCLFLSIFLCKGDLVHALSIRICQFMKFLCIAVGIHAKATVILTLHFLSFYCFFFYKIRTLHPEKTTVIVNFLIIPLCFYICLPVLAHICSKIILCICVFQFSTHPTPCRFHTVILCFFLKFYLHLFRCRRFIRCKLHPLSGCVLNPCNRCRIC